MLKPSDSEQWNIFRRKKGWINGNLPCERYFGWLPKWPLFKMTVSQNDRYFATKWPLFFVFWTTVILGIPNDRYLYQNDHYSNKKMTIIFGLQWCWWHRYVADIVMLVIILRCWWHNKDARDMPIGHQHNYMHECDVGDWLIMLKT